MILLVSQEYGESTTEHVMDWIDALGGTCVRINGEDLDRDAPYTMSFSNRGHQFHLTADGLSVCTEDIRSAWFRRSHRLESLKALRVIDESTAHKDVERFMRRELGAALDFFFSMFDRAEWISTRQAMSISKMDQLRAAARAGFDIPETLITNSRRELLAFNEASGPLITKVMRSGTVINYGGYGYSMYTSRVRAETLEQAPTTFFPTLFQEMLDKDYELRVFYLNGESYAMAIFSQLDTQTSVDFRRYNHRHPNRFVPYRLPDAIRDTIRRFMDDIDLGTGSLDLVRTKDGRYVFLEVNPEGQFGMVSGPCNYRLEKKVAAHLIERDVSPTDSASPIPA